MGPDAGGIGEVVFAIELHLKTFCEEMLLRVGCVWCVLECFGVFYFALVRSRVTCTCKYVEASGVGKVVFLRLSCI